MQCVGTFGEAVEALLVKHGRSIVDKQYELTRLANAAIDIYSSAVVLSRASRALQSGSPTAKHEENLANIWCSEVKFSVKPAIRFS
jgi:very long chain acyl-CoA dehydrogenase